MEKSWNFETHPFLARACICLPYFAAFKLKKDERKYNFLGQIERLGIVFIANDQIIKEGEKKYFLGNSMKETFSFFILEEKNSVDRGHVLCVWYDT